eukprot:1195743-Prorocentrum_minimum.AAC.2
MPRDPTGVSSSHTYIPSVYHKADRAPITEGKSEYTRSGHQSQKGRGRSAETANSFAETRFANDSPGGALGAANTGTARETKTKRCFGITISFCLRRLSPQRLPGSPPKRRGEVLTVRHSPVPNIHTRLSS